MRHSSVLHVLGWLIAVLAVAMVLPILVAMANAEVESARAFMISAAVTGFSGGALIMAFRGVPSAATRSDMILVLVLGWSVLPVFAAFPFASLGAPAGATSSYFEAVSGLTSTGATLLTGRLDGLPRAVLAWRATLQWLGGLGTLVAAVVLLTPLGVGGMALGGTSLARGDATSLSARMRQTSGQIIGLYAAITMACFISLWAGGISGFDAFCLSLSTVSTGGFMVRDGALSDYDAPFSILILTVFMMIGAMSFATHRTALRGNFREYWANPEAAYLMSIILIVGGLLSLTIFFGQTGGPGALASGFFLAISMATTSGFLLDGPEILSDVPPVLALAVALVGGSTLSTAGGLKLMRLSLLLRQGGRELKRLAHPHGIIPTSYGDRAIDISMMKGIWVFFILYVFCLIIITLLVGATGVGTEASLGAAASALSNTGPAYLIVEAVIPGAEPYAAFPAQAKWLLSVGMIVGRIEVVALLSLLHVAYWRH